MKFIQYDRPQITEFSWWVIIEQARPSAEIWVACYGWPFGPAISVISKHMAGPSGQPYANFYLKLKCLLKGIYGFLKDNKRVTNKRVTDRQTDRPTDRPTCSKLMFFMLKVYKGIFSANKYNNRHTKVKISYSADDSLNR